MSLKTHPVAVEIQGGLGNQLFQYCAARSISTAFGSSVTLDIRLLDKDEKRQFGLGSYRVQCRSENSAQLARPGRLRRWAAHIGLRTGSLRHYPFDAPIFREDDRRGCFDERVSALRPPVVLHGYFQSERYFSTIASALRDELVPLRVPCPTYLQIEHAIREAGPASVSVHVRRGDYANDPKVLAVHGLLGPDYYGPALSLLGARVSAPQLFVFTDDLPAAAALLPPGLPATMVSGRGLSDVDELALMSTCRHHVIANSSYSWWGAWLGAPDGMTIAPRRWFAQPSEAAIRDRFPAHWHVVG